MCMDAGLFLLTHSSTPFPSHSPNPSPSPSPNPSPPESLPESLPQSLPQDPREYLPFLNQLRKLPPPYRYYTIDKHLGRYKKALRNIVACGELSSLKVVLLVQQIHSLNV